MLSNLLSVDCVFSVKCWLTLLKWKSKFPRNKWLQSPCMTFLIHSLSDGHPFFTVLCCSSVCLSVLPILTHLGLYLVYSYDQSSSADISIPMFPVLFPRAKDGPLQSLLVMPQWQQGKSDICMPQKATERDLQFTFILTVQILYDSHSPYSLHFPVCFWHHMTYTVLVHHKINQKQTPGEFQDFHVVAYPCSWYFILSSLTHISLDWIGFWVIGHMLTAKIA